MSIASELATFFEDTGQPVRIEIEGKPGAIEQFIQRYNDRYNQSLTENSEGVVVLEEGANKWGIEYRLYFNDDNGLPIGVTVTRNRSSYQGQYSLRINDNNVIEELFEYGFKVGEN